MKANDWYNLLACPICKNPLSKSDIFLLCQKCNNTYSLRDGVSYFIDTLLVNQEENETLKSNNLIKKITSKLKDTIPPHTMWTDETIFKFINSLDNKLILNLGSGKGLFDNKINVSMINLDIHKYDNTNIIADAHALPFLNSSLDCVYSNAVLEHVKQPWVVASEIDRILKPGGFIIINLPFLNVIHDEHDYFRFTLKGIKELFLNYTEIAGGVSSGGGSFLPICLIQYTSMFIPTKFLRTLHTFISSHILFRLKMIDKWVINKPDYFITANSFYFIGQKP